MEFLTVILLAVGLMALAMAGLAIKILIKKGGKFPNTHVSGNRHLKKNKIYCAQTQDKLAQREGWKNNNFEKVKFASDIKVGK